ncbi:MAG: hypothetical protein AB2747_09950 [Candidatus Thiodiazotropha taylori]
MKSKPEPKVKEVKLSKKYSFMYENFVIATQSDTYLLLEKTGDIVDAIKFNSRTVKYGGPNDEGRGAHPLMGYGLGFYGLYEVENSPWIHEQMTGNRVHPRHSDSLFSGYKHYIACFKDVMFEVTCDSYEEVHLPVAEVGKLVNQQLDYLNE